MGHGTKEFDDDTGETPSVPQTLPERARALRAAVAQDVAVIAWLGYDTPGTIPSALAAENIQTGAANLTSLMTFLAQGNPQARLTWICHSYGSLICASALHADSLPQTREPDAVALVGSPGVHARRASDLSSHAEIWAGRGGLDPIDLSGLLSVAGGDFGPDPSRPAFGAHEIVCDPGTSHSGYFSPGSRQLTTLARISTG
jgi:hypothetical protein